MKSFISFSGGVESTTMCVLFSNKADAIFADTGAEHYEMYKRLDKVEQWIQKNIRKTFKIHRVKNSKYKDGLTGYVLKQKYLPSFSSRYCTRLFKIEPIDNYLEQYKNDGVILMIGLNIDEIDQRTGNHGNKKFIKYTYPLANNGISRSKCKEILTKLNLLPDFPCYMQRGGCKYCYYKSKKEYEAMALLNEVEFNEVMELEEKIQDARKAFFSIIPNMPMRRLKSNVSNIIFKPSEIYPTINNVTKCGVFCNR